jgi:enediyne biosynthesis protein E4
MRPRWGKVQSKCVMRQSSYLSANDPRLHFGLGSAAIADVEVHWPSGQNENCRRVSAGQLITIREGHGIVANTMRVLSERSLDELAANH